jgi:23S rRNA (uracil1939-C5)-methyltransferase
VTDARGEALVIEKLIPDGKALGHLADGRVVIVAGAVPGDHIALEEVTQSKGLVQGRRFRLLSPSRLRTIPRCTVAAECGGCDWMILRPEQQHLGKVAVLVEALLRTGKIDVREHPPRIFTGRLSDGYRARVRLQVQNDRIGFYQRGSHDLVEPDHCAVSSPAVNAALGVLRGLARAHAGALACFSWLELRQASDGTVSVLLERNGERFGDATRAFMEVLRRQFIVVDDTASAEAPASWQRFQLTPETYMLSSPASFTQVNWEVNQALIARVVEGAAERRVRSFLDVYAGSGNFTLPLLAQGLSGVAVESNRTSILAAREAADRQGLVRGSFVAADAVLHALELHARGQSFQLVVIDPPRAGVKSGLAALARLAKGWLVMCSCNPVTLARDLRSLLDLGFEIESIEAFDMFPQTHHFETLVWLRAPAP